MSEVFYSSKLLTLGVVDSCYYSIDCSLRIPDVDAALCLQNVTKFKDGFCVNASGVAIGIWNYSAAAMTGFKRVLPASEFYK